MPSHILDFSSLIEKQTDWVSFIGFFLILVIHIFEKQILKLLGRSKDDHTSSSSPGDKVKESASPEQTTLVMDKPATSKHTPKTPLNKINLKHLNTYDLFKLWAILTMYCDHYGYMSLPGISYSTMRWTRCVGRAAAPCFFYLSGYATKRFRWRIWWAGVFLYIFTVKYHLRLIYTPNESIFAVAVINCVFFYFPVSAYNHVAVHLALFCGLFYANDWVSTRLYVGYGAFPFMIAIAGDLQRHQHKFAKFWVIGCMFMYGRSSNRVFAQNMYHSSVIFLVTGLNALVMCFFQMKTIPAADKLGVVKDALANFTRHGLTAYIGHLLVYRCIYLSNKVGEL